MPGMRLQQIAARDRVGRHEQPGAAVGGMPNAIQNKRAAVEAHLNPSVRVLVTGTRRNTEQPAAVTPQNLAIHTEAAPVE